MFVLRVGLWVCDMFLEKLLRHHHIPLHQQGQYLYLSPPICLLTLIQLLYASITLHGELLTQTNRSMVLQSGAARLSILDGET